MAVAGLVVATLALIVSAAAAAYARKSANAAAVQAASAAKALDIQRQATHDAYDPTGVLDHRFFVDHAGEISPLRGRYIEFTLPRKYELRILVAPTKDGRLLPSQPHGRVLRGVPLRAFVDIPQARDRARTVLIQLWPPAVPHRERGVLPEWTCPCDRPPRFPYGSERAHWEIEIPVPDYKG